MFTTKDSHFHKPLAVPSQTAALRELNSWLALSNYKVVEDAHGIKWNFDLAIHESPDVTMKKMNYKIQLGLKSTMTTEVLLENGVLDATKDQRLIGLIGASQIPFFMSWSLMTAGSTGECKSALMDKIPNIKKYMKSADLYLSKRKIVEEFVDRKMAFGGLAFKTAK